ncbi:MAG: hypothetical protein K9N51_07140 [Candidatus Pacebacteria bacterium]|nr:hypothetical protein [Candidatus Paceibacterota bacterium]
MSPSAKPDSHRGALPGIPRRMRFTLVEVLLAVSILVFGIVGILSGYAKTTDSIRVAREHMDVYGLLKEKMGEAELEARSSTSGLAHGVTRGDFGERYLEYEWQRDVKAAPYEGLDEVTLTITCRRNERVYTLATYLVRPEQETDD